MLGSLFSNKSSSKGGDQNTLDGRITAGSESNAVSLNQSSGNTINATTTDMGAISASMDLALKGIETVGNLAGQTITASSQANSQAGSIVSGALGQIGAQAEQFKDALENIKAGDARPLMYVAIGAVVLVVGFVAFSAKKG